MSFYRRLPLCAFVSLLGAGCGASPSSRGGPPLHTVAHVDLPSYMGDWRVIAEIPYFAERNCVDSIESYGLLPDGSIHNWFTFRKGSFSAAQGRIDAHAYVTDHSTNAEWKVEFLDGLISSPYLVLDLDPNYQWTVVGVPSRKEGWIMARSKTLPPDVYQGILHRLAAQGYDPDQFKLVPQLPSELPHP
jgi:apolipoprotein D and lipocalin family protein